MSQVQAIDEQLLKIIHHDGGNKVFDVWMPFLRNPYFWSPLYLFILVWLWYNRRAIASRWLLYAISVFACCDYLSASIIKPFIHRLRPCHEFFSFPMRKLMECGSGYSFPSAHAANHFGISLFIFFTLGKEYPSIRIWVIVWAFLVCYAQMYVLAHYPSDIFIGSLIGIFFGSLMARIYHRVNTLSVNGGIQ